MRVCVDIYMYKCVYVCVCVCDDVSAYLSCPGPVCWYRGVGGRMPSMKDPYPVSVCIMA